MVGGDIQRKGEVQTFGLVGRAFSGLPDLPIRKTLRRLLGLLNVMTLKRVIESFSFKATDLQHVSLRMEKSGKFFDAVQSTKDYPRFQDKHLRT